MIGNRLHHEIRAVADIRIGAEENSANADGNHMLGKFLVSKQHFMDCRTSDVYVS